jgi:alpha,alpha-trehalase
VADVCEIDGNDIDAVIFDLDGVITRTAAVHREAWAKLFNEYLKGRSEETGEEFRPFEATDYLEFVDGKPRYDGVASFLESRDIDLPWGSDDDGPDAETVCGLGNRKNGYFLDTLESEGVEQYDPAVDFVRTLQANGIATALISSSRNVDEVLEAAGLSDLFTVQVDGNVAAELRLPGKPDPAVFVEAASRFGVGPDRAAIVEDAQSGVQAGSAGGFRIVLGVNRGDDAQRAELEAGGATAVVDNLGQVSVTPASPEPRASLPSALEDMEKIQSRIGDGDVAVFLDYDGVLTPIVPHPDLAILSDDMRSVLQDLASVVTVAVVSGRDVDDVRSKVDVPGIYYAGSHGFDIVAPDGKPVEDDRLDTFNSYLDSLDRATHELEQRLDGVDGAQIERKKFAIAVHYRRVAESEYPIVEEAVRAVAPGVPDLRVTTGKMIYEFRPDFDWDKGRALQWLEGELDLHPPTVVPLYLGDDTTDEDAFRVIRNVGIGVVVGREGEESLAHYALEDTDEVRALLVAIAGMSR